VDCSIKVRNSSSSVFLLLAASCATGYSGPGAPEPDAGPPDDASFVADGGDEETSEVAALTDGAWESMDFDARRQFMQTVVLPRMRVEFAAFDPVRFEKLSCRSCHGSGLTDGSFAMPAADLPVLDREALMNPEESKKPILDFMRQIVRPRLSELLGLGTDDASTLRCSTCHTYAE
jgi:hypothetical protein